MDLSRIFNVFSRRPQPAASSPRRLTPEFRNRVIQLCVTTFPQYKPSYGFSPALTTFWSEIREKLLYFHGIPSLSGRLTTDPASEIITFVLGSSDEHFLDFIEFVFQTNAIHSELDSRTGNRVNISSLVGNINTFIEVDDLPYHLTEFTIGSGRIEAYPQIIRRDSAVLSATAIKPVLALLSQPGFTSANEEFLDALKDFRSGDYRDCVVKCGSSLESVMKIICDKKGWSYQQTDTANTLLNNILPRTSLDSYFRQPIMLIATIRNRLSKAHGAGTQQKTVPRHVANYVVNTTASAILLLVDESNP